MAAHDHITRWTPQRKVAVIEQLLQGITTPEEIRIMHKRGLPHSHVPF
jgi:hypothetical protein